MDLRNLELAHLRAFEKVAGELHFRRAAEALRCTQPALSRKIKDLEALLGFPLFERDTRNVTLLPPGLILRDHLTKVFGEIELACERARSAALGKSGLLRIGVVGAPAMSFIHKPLRNFKRAYPEYEISLEEESSTRIASRIADGALECGFYLSSVNHPKLDQRLVHHDQLAIAVSIDHPLVTRKRLKLRDLAGQKIILFPRDRNPVFFDQIAGGIPDFTEDQVVEASSRQTAIMMAAANLGVAVIAESMRSSCPDSVKYLPIHASELGVDVVMGWRKGRTNILEAFL